MLFSKTVGKRLVDVKTQNSLGEITAISLDKPSGICFLETENNSYYAEKLTLEGDAAKAKNAIKTEKYAECKIGLPIYGRDAEFLGEISDVEFSPALKFKSVISTKGEKYTKGRIAALCDALLIRPKRGQKSGQKNTAENRQTDKKTADGKILAESEQKKEAHTKSTKKTKRYGDFGFLIGKTVDKTITNFQGEIMIKNGDAITKDLLRQAKISGKLVELCLHTK